MKKIILSLVALFATVGMYAQQAEYFKPYKEVSLRLPSIPLVVNDPYFSLWSPYDKLNGGNTKHWSDIRKPMDGLLRVDGKTYRWMGKQTQFVLGNPLMPMTQEERWTAKATFDAQTGEGWTSEKFDDSSWPTKTAAFGSKDDNHPNINTPWTETGTQLYVRRHVTLTKEDLAKDLYVKFSHDDTFYLYVNGHKIIDTGYTWVMNETHKITDTEKAYLHEGDNVVAVLCKNEMGGAYLDFGIYENLKLDVPAEEDATQTAVDVLACNTYYSFKCGAVNLDVVFTAPMIIDDLDLISTPINYISYQVTSNDGQEHDVQFYFGVTPEMCVYDVTQEVQVRSKTTNGIPFVLAGTTSQPVLKRAGDLITIDWGYLYLPGVNGVVSVASFNDSEKDFCETGAVVNTMDVAKPVTFANGSQYPVMSYVKDFGKVKEDRSFMMLGYDEKYDITYFGKNYKGYWTHGNMTIEKAFSNYSANYDENMQKARQQDIVIYDDAYEAAGGSSNKTGAVKYAELLSGTYRQVLAAHKLFKDASGNLLYFSKENNSNGCVNTVDLTYPSAPLFLCYNPDLELAMCTSILEYSYTKRWTKPFAAHDLGTYPIANGQVYGGDMPLEESGNILVLLAEIADRKATMGTEEELNTYINTYVKKYWNILTTWVDYLVENGADPADQLCTDDFAGVWAHNCNLSVKAIMAIAGYAKLAAYLGYTEKAETYMNIAKEMGVDWEKRALDVGKDHYRIAFDRNNTWGMKYNMVWDQLWKTELFPSGTIEREIKYYLGKMNTWGLPLDSRAMYTKGDWLLWVATMASSNSQFSRFVNPEWKYANETHTRWPLSDWHYTDSYNVTGFRARSVLGGYWMKVLKEMKLGNLVNGIKDVNTESMSNGAAVKTIENGKIVIRRNGKTYNVEGKTL